MSDDLVYWKNALMGISGPIHENDPQCGWYRTKPRSGFASLPVRIWRDPSSGEMRAMRGRRAVEPGTVWIWCCLNPVSQDRYEAALRGEPWPDGVPTRKTESGMASGQVLGPMPDGQASSMPRGQAAPMPRGRAGREHGIGRNSGKLITDHDGSKNHHLKNHSLSDDACERGQNSTLAKILDPFADAREMTDHITLLWDDVSSWLQTEGSITDQVSADRSANYASAFSNLEALSEDMRVREKKPFLEACRSVDAKWKPVLEAAKHGKAACKMAIESYLVSEWVRREDLAVRKGVAFDPPRAGSLGRSISVRSVEKTVITDIEILLAHYVHDARLLKDERLSKLIRELADEDLKLGLSVPGAELFTTRTVI